MLRSFGRAIVEIITAVPVNLLVLYAALLGLLGLACGRQRREYLTDLGWQALETSIALAHGRAA